MTIRRLPQDFRVDEEVSSAFVNAEDAASLQTHAVYRLTKVSLTTPEAASMLAKALGVRPGHVEHAGLKDKHAATRQHVTVPREALAGREPPASAGEGDAGEAAWQPGAWRAELAGWAGHAISSKQIERNRFAIVVRDLSEPAAEEMEHRARTLLDADGSLLIANYFGDQRFGSARHGEGFAGVALAKENYLEAIKLLIATPARKDTGKKRAFTRMAIQKWGDWSTLARELPQCVERRAIEALAAGKDAKAAFDAIPSLTKQMAVEALQSHLWNGTVRGMMRALAQRGAPVIAAHDDFGEMLFASAAAVPQEWRELQIPTLSSDTTPNEPWGPAAEATVREMGLSIADLRVRGLRRPAFGEALRPMFVRAFAFTIGPMERDELSKRWKREVRFALPRGAYATVVLRALGQ